MQYHIITHFQSSVFALCFYLCFNSNIAERNSILSFSRLIKHKTNVNKLNISRPCLYNYKSAR